MLVLVSAIVVSAVLNVDATSLPYFEPPSPVRPSWNYAFKAASSIPRELGEKLLVWDEDKSDPRIARSLIVLVNKEYPVVHVELRRLLTDTLGIAEEQDSLSGPIPEPNPERPPYTGYEYPPWPLLGEGLSFIQKDKHSNPPREYQLTSKPYNKLESINGFSEVRIRVSDGKQFLGKAVTILQILRRDYSREWARAWHLAIPLPYKEDRAFTVVTNTEVAMVEKLKKRIPGLEIRYFVLALQLLELDRDYNNGFMASMKKAVSQFEGN